MMRRLLLLSISLLLSLFGLLHEASAATITVTTNQDESGGDSTVCSLREALQASATKAAVAGCTAGQQYFVDTIQLAANTTYTLTQGPLVVNTSVVINGDGDSDPSSIDPITGTAPESTKISTTIVAAPNSRIFDTSTSLSSLTLDNLALVGGTANGTGDSGNGGAILAGGTVTLYRVGISNSTASQQGGAIYIEGAQSTLTATSSFFTGNTAPQGAVLAMSCFDNLIPTARTFTITQSSFTGNGSASTSSVLDFCGQPTTTITASTIAQNNAQGTDSSGLASGVVRIVGAVNTRLGSNSTLSLLSDTLAENNSPAALAYTITSGLSLVNNIVAFNNGAADCQYSGSSSSSVTTSESYNLFQSTSSPGTPATSRCTLYPSGSTNDATTNIYAGTSNTLSDYVSPLGDYGDPNVQLLGYLPVANGPLIHKGTTLTTCGGNDQRGLTRGSGVAITNSSTCDIGALDLSIFNANDDSGTTNISYLSVTTPTYAANQVSAYQSTFRYREAIINVLANDSAEENLTSAGNSSLIDVLSDSTKYTVTGSDSGNIHCEWNATMGMLLASRDDGTITPGGATDSCQYTIKNLADGTKTSATASFTIVNIAPVANNFTLTLPFGASSVPLNILANASDDGNGPVGSKNYPNVVVNGQTMPKPVFYQDSRVVNGVVTTVPANIIIVTPPTQGHIVAQYQEPCANNNVNTTQNICYGGTLTYVNDNLFSPFNDSFQYQVLNYDLAPSNTATVTITNTATTTDQTKAGGGGVGLGALLGLIALVMLRRQRMIG